MSDFNSTYYGDVKQLNQINKQYIMQSDCANLEEQNRKIMHLKYTIDREQIRNLVQEWAYNLKQPQTIRPLVLTVLGADQDSPINLVKGIKTMLLEPIVEKYQVDDDEALSVSDKSVAWPSVDIPPDKRIKQLIKRLGKACFDDACKDLDELVVALKKRQQHMVLSVQIMPEHWDPAFPEVFNRWLEVLATIRPLDKSQLVLFTHVVKVASGWHGTAVQEQQMQRFFDKHSVLSEIPPEFELDELEWCEQVHMFCRRLSRLTPNELRIWVQTCLRNEVDKLALALDEQKVLISINKQPMSESMVMSEAEAVIEQSLNESLLSLPQ